VKHALSSLLVLGLLTVGVLIFANALQSPQNTDSKATSLKKTVYFGVAISPDQFTEEPYLKTLTNSNFSSVTPESNMQIKNIHPDRNRYTFEKADAIVDFAQSHNMRVRGHALVNKPTNGPTWLLDGNYSKEEYKQILKDHIQTIVSRYKGKVAVWDVVNEQDNLGFWKEKIGPEYFELSFQWAHEADPDAELFYNDDNIEGLDENSTRLYNQIKELKNRGIPIHGVGFQMHVNYDDSFKFQDIATNMKRYSNIGVKVHITEMDVSLKTAQPSQDLLQKQAEVFGQVARVCYMASNCDSFSVWGITDKYNWPSWFFNRPDAPLLFDINYNPKPAYSAVNQALLGVFPNPSPTPQSHTISIFAAGTKKDVLPTLKLVINGKEVKRWKDVSGDAGKRQFQEYTYTTITELKENSIEVHNVIPNGVTRLTAPKLTIDRIVVDGKTFQTEDRNTLGKEVWKKDKCILHEEQAEGYFQTESLCGWGSFKYNLGG